MGETIINIIICFFYSFIIYKILKELLSLKEVKWAKPLLFLIIFYSSDTIIYPKEVTGSIIILLEFLLIVLLCCSHNFVRNLSSVLIFYPLIVSINYLTQDIGSLIWQYLFNQNMTPIAEIFLNSLASTLRIPFWYLIYLFTRKRLADISQSLTGKMWLIIDAVCITSFIGIITVVYNSSPATSYITYPACFACIFTGLGICYLCSYISQSMKTAMEVKVLKYQQSYYEELENSQEKTRKLRHDMKNHFNVIHTFLKNQDTKKALDYLSNLSDELTNEFVMFCQNNIVNAILNTKYNLAKEYHIKCSFQFDIGNDTGIDSISLCSLIANTLDNAIEASMQVTDISKRSISAKARCYNGFFCYEIRNAKANNVIEKDSRIQTGKKDSATHGFGLQNITDIVNRYHGTIEIAYTEQDFSVITLIPIKKATT